MARLLTDTRAATELPDATIQEFGKGLRGTLVRPTDDGYDAARAVYNGMIDKRPGLIAQCSNIADVVHAVNFARENELLVAVRGGGHNGGGLGTCDDGLVIDLSPMRGIIPNPSNQTVRVQGGCRWGDVDHATHVFGLATPSGILSTTGVGGLTLGGGLGHLSRKYGLTIDNLLQARVVLADGSVVTASEKENEDLFWALRGGGGNFGVVTSFVFRQHPVHTIVGGPTFWEMDDAADVMRWYREFIGSAPEELNGFFAFLKVPPVDPFPKELHMRTMCGVVWCYAGQQERVFAPVQGDIRPRWSHIAAMPYPALQSAFDALYPPGMRWYWRADFVGELSDEAIDRHVAHGRSLPTLHSTMHLYPINGAVNRVGQNETAFSFREVTWAQVIVGVDPLPANDELIRSWCVNYWEDLHPHSAGGAYVNFLMEEGQERVQATYRDNYARLARIKTAYDPDNLFQVNQNIRPAD